MKRVPKYYLRQQRWLLGFASLVFFGFGVSLLVRMAARLASGGPAYPGPASDVPPLALTILVLLGGGGLGLWVTVRWSKWVGGVAKADRALKPFISGSRMNPGRILFDAWRELVGDGPTRIAPSKSARRDRKPARPGEPKPTKPVKKRCR